MSDVTLKIIELGAQGDGVAEHDGHKVFVPLALPGETVKAEISGDRTEPISNVERFRPEAEVLELYESLWDGEWYEDPVQKARYHDAGRAAVKHVRTRTLDEKPQPWLVESPFSIKVGPYTVRGKIDRVDRLPDGRAVIIDYKTGKSKEEIPADMKAQLAIYQLALHDVHGVETAEMRFWFVNDDVVAPVDPAKDIEKVRAKLEERITELATSDFAPTPGEHTCKYCDFKDICRFKVL